MSESEDERGVSARRLREVFGEVLPSTTSDERDPGSAGSAGSAGSGPPADEAARDEWLLRNRPPHHD